MLHIIADMRLYSYTRAISSAIQFVGPLSGKNYEKIYGNFYSEHPMGYNFEITISASSGLKDKIQQIINEVHEKFDHCFINQLPDFSELVPTFEVLALTIYKQAQKVIDDSELSIILKVDGENWVKVTSVDKVQVTKSYKINCVHRHHNPDLTQLENKKLYGKCSAIHDHEYTVEVSLCGSLNEDGQVIGLDEVDKIVNQNLVKPFHKTYLNDEMGNTSGELISELFYKRLSPVLPKNLSFDLTLRETRKNSFVKLA